MSKPWTAGALELVDMVPASALVRAKQLSAKLNTRSLNALQEKMFESAI